MRRYICLNKQIYSGSIFELTPIRYEDRYCIMNWRNEQLYHLRQENPLTRKEQDSYFNTVISKLFDVKYPDQILFSILKNEKCIAYGGLVHINWKLKSAEISFVMNTELEKNNFESYWSAFLNLIEDVAFNELNFKKIFTYSYNKRPKLYKALLNCNFKKENEFFDNDQNLIKIHAKYN